MVKLIPILSAIALMALRDCAAFLHPARTNHHNILMHVTPQLKRTSFRLNLWDDDQSPKEIDEEARLNVLDTRRYRIRSVLKAAESVRNFRLSKDMVPELDPETGKPIKSDSKAAVALTAFVVAAGAILLRVGGRAALVSAVGLDFANDNPELKEQMDQILLASEAMDPVQKLLIFTAGWTAVKVLCFDAGGVVLALVSGILFGGVIQGAVISAAAATFGSTIAFGLAKIETPVRKKALELLDTYPSLRGIEKVVARDGLKAILTLRLAPVLPIPIGLYNYVYGVTNVPFFDFAGGIFLGSLKPYLLDSYLGVFGKSIVDGDSSNGLEDFLLLGALGLSILIGVFASQLAGETWESVLEEVEAEKKKRKELGEDADDRGSETKEFLGLKLPEWTNQVQVAFQEADERVRAMIAEECDAQVWNYTKAEGGPPRDRDPAFLPTSQESMGAYKGFDFGAVTADGLVETPLLFEAFMKYSDPLFKSDENGIMRESANRETVATPSATEGNEDILEKLQSLRSAAREKIKMIDAKTKSL